MRSWWPRLLGLLLLLVALPACGQDADLHTQASRPAVRETHAMPAGAERVEVGIYPTIVNALDAAGSTYDVTAYVWLKWKGPIDPSAHLEFVNLVQRYDFTREALFDKPQAQPGGGAYQILQIHGRFFQPFEFANFPFDRQALTLELHDEYRAHENLVYEPDDRDSGYASDLEIPGWRILGWRSHAIVRDYASSFGGARGSSYAGLRYELVIARHTNYFLWKLFLPLLIVLCANWLALMIDPELVDVRTALPATSLLTMVFLQQSYSSELPEIGTLVLMDKIYACAYLLVMATLFQVIFMRSWQKSGAAVPDARVSYYDRIGLSVHLALFATVVLLVLHSGGVF
jgi:hypothetical protein